MLPLSLTIEGIYSYRNRITINFETLCKDNLFGIFGAVGSGKSSILEAITYSIYGQTDRMNRNDKVAANMLNLSSNALYIEFSFLADNQTWTAIRQLKRTGKQKEKVELLVPSFYKEIEGIKIPVSEQELQQAVGLSYENFRRVIIIPQGKFQEFLQLTDNERSEMLKELFPELQKYDLSEKTSELLTQTKSELDSKSGELTGLGEMNEGDIQTKEEVLIKSLEIANQTHLQAENLAKELQVLLDIKKVSDSLEMAKKDLQVLSEQASAISQYDNTLKEYEGCVNVFKTDIAFWEKEKLSLADIQNKKQESLTQNQHKVLEKETALQVINQLSLSYNNRQYLLQKADELKKIGTVLQIEKEIQRQNNTLQGLQTGYTQNQQSLQTLVEKRNVANKAIQTKQALLLDELLLTNITNWFTEYKSLIQTQQKLQNQVQELEEKVQSYIVLRNEEAAKIPFLNELSTLSFEAINTEIENEQLRLENPKQNLETRLRELHLKQRLSEYSHALHKGEPCPLCGSLEHPQILQTADVTDHINSLQTQLHKIAENKERNNKLSKAFENLKNKWENANDSLANEEQHLAESTNNLEEHTKNFPPSEFSWQAPEKFFTAVESNNHTKNEVLRIQQQKTELDIQIANIEQSIQQQNAQCQELQNKIATSTGSAQSFKQQLNLLSFTDYITKDTQTIEEEAKQLEKEHTEIEKNYTESTQKLQKIEQDIAHLNGVIQNLTIQETDKQTSIVEKESDLNKKLAQSNVNNLTQIKTILAQDIDIQAYRNKIEQYKQAVYETNSRINSLTEQLGNKQYNAELYAALQAQHNAKREELRTLNEEIGKLKSELATLKSNIEKQKTLQADLNKLHIRHSNLLQMRSLFMGNKFVKFVSKLYLQEMCNAANSRFLGMTKNQLRLELNENGNFVIRDFLNGGKTRNVKTLSGGQTFQAALALALAITDNLRIGENTQNFFFLDEGFGSLDKDSLNIVFETLRSLHKEQRIVGFISHVEEMKEQMSHYLLVKNTEEEGSVIEMV